MKKNIKPTEAELEVLDILWSEGPSSVRQVHEALSSKKDVYYTTTLKTMQVMHEKGFVNRDTSTRSHIYSAIISRSSVQQNLLNRLVHSVFGGSKEQLILSALGGQNASQEDLQRIKSMIEELKKNES